MLSKYKLYYLTPIKKYEQDLYFIISLTNQTSHEISLFYFKINILTGEYFSILSKNYHPKSILDNDCFLISQNIECQIMNSNENKKVFTCFYMTYSDFSISVTSFDYENNLKELYSNQTLVDCNIGIVRAKSIGNKSNCLN
jgi:hypothetical protein